MKEIEMLCLPTGTFIDKNTPIYQGSNFTWGEATKNLSRPIQDLIINNKVVCNSEQIEDNIIKTATYLDKIRAMLANRPIYITSWYRPSHINQAVGGASNSQHTVVSLLNFKYSNISDSQVSATSNCSLLSNDCSASSGVNHHC